MSRQIRRRARRAAPCEICRRSDEDATHRPADAHGDHVRRRVSELADCRIEALGHDVVRIGVDVQVELYVRIGREIARPDRHDHDGRRGEPRDDRQSTVRALAIAVEVLNGPPDLIQSGPESGEQTLAGVSQGHLARGAVKQAHAVPFFDLADRVAEG